MNGIFSTDWIENANWQYYIYIPDEQSDLEIRAVPEYGRLKVYVGLKAPVGIQNRLWESSTKENSEVVKISNSDVNNLKGRFYIGVLALENTRYSIVAYAKSSVIKISDGQIQTLSLENFELKLNLFINPSSADPYELYCSLKTYSDSFRPYIYINFEEKGKNIAFPTQGFAQYIYDDKNEYDQLYNSLDFFLPQNGPGNYHILLYSSYKYHEKPLFTFFCASEFSVLNLQLNSQHIQHSNTDFSPRNFVIDVPNESYLRVYVIPCSGDVLLQISKNSEDFQFKDPSIEILSFNDGSSFSTIPSALGKYYVRVTSMSNSETSHENSFQIITETYKINENKKDRLMPGEIYYEISGDKYIITWEEVKYDNNGTPDSGIEYYLYQSSYTESYMESVCGMRNAAKLNLAKEIKIGDKTTATIHISKLTRVNIVAVNTFNPNSYLSYIAYSPIQLTKINSESNNGSIWYIALFILIMTMSILSIIFYQHKKRQTQNNQFYELREVNRQN